jgi:hypothetical protein
VNMRFSLLFVATVAKAAAVARNCEAPGPGEDGRYTISAEGIKAQVCERYQQNASTWANLDSSSPMVPP